MLGHISQVGSPDPSGQTPSPPCLANDLSLELTFFILYTFILYTDKDSTNTKHQCLIIDNQFTKLIGIKIYKCIAQLFLCCLAQITIFCFI